MKKLPGRIARKKEMGKLYDSLLANVPGVELVPTNYEDTSPWFFDILCERREELQAFLKEKGVGSRIFYPPLHAEPAYGYHELSFPVTEEVSRKGLWLPSSVFLTDGQVRYVCDLIKEFYGVK